MTATQDPKQFAQTLPESDREQFWNDELQYSTTSLQRLSEFEKSMFVSLVTHYRVFHRRNKD